MPLTREQHVTYTREELHTQQYYIDVINTLKNDNITSYIDIGANVGEFCNVLYESIPTLKTAHLFEPEVANYNFMVNHVTHVNVPYNLAIGYGFKSPKLTSHPTNNVGGFMLVESENTDLNDVKVVTLEELDLPIVDLIKMDVEGAEYNIIENSTILQKTKWLEIEFHMTPEQVSQNYSVIFVNKYLPNHSIEIIEPTSIGRMLLKLK